MVLAKELVDKLKKIEDFDITYESSDKDSGEIYIDYNNIVFVLEHYIYEGKFYLSGGLHTITYKGKEYYSDVLPYYLDVDYDSDTYNGVDELVSMIEDDIKGCDFKKKLRRLISVVDSIYEDFDEAVDEVKRRHADNYEYALKVLDKYQDPKSDWEKGQVERANKIIEGGIGISYEDAWEEAKKWGYDMDDDENLLSTYNPESKWDWYSEGGRWGAWLILKEKDENGVPLTAIFATKSEVDWDRMFPNRVPFCFVTEDGEWHESASMGWWGMTSDDKEEDVWNKEFKEYLDSVGDDVEISVIDFHI